MGISQACWIERVTLDPGVRTPVLPPRVSTGVSIGNGSSGDVKVYSHLDSLDDTLHYLVVPMGYERPITVPRNAFHKEQIAFWMESAGGGLVVLIWL